MTRMHSLRIKLLLVFALVALAPVGTASYLIYRTNAEAFRSYSEERTQLDANSIAKQIDELTGKDTVVVDANAVVVSGEFGQVSTLPGTSSESGGGSVFSIGAGAGGSNSGNVAITTGSVGGIGTSEGISGGVVGSAATESNGFTIALPGLPDARYLNSMTDALLIAVGLAAAGAMVLAFLLASHILKPVETMTAAAHAMAAGDLRRRVTVRSQDELGVLAGAFNTMAESRSKLEELRRNLVNDVAHELRTPLANLQGYLEVLRDDIAAPTPEVLAILHEESLLLSRLVTDLQELALAEAGQLPLTPAPSAVSDSILNAAEALQPQVEAKGVTLSTSLPEMLPPALVDVSRLSQILRNLLRNAIAHTPAGGAIEISARAGVETIAISVRDSGSGISPEHLPYVFDRFYRADPARARSTGGTGLGLAIVKHLVEAHHGQIDVASTPGAGTVFTFTLPVAA